MHLRYLALIPVVVLLASVLATLLLGVSNKIYFNPPYLLLELNLVFWTIATVSIVSISVKSYLNSGSLTVLLLSSSIIIFGLSVIISGWVGTFSGPLSVSISNPCLLVASMIQVLSSVLSFRSINETQTSSRKRVLVTVYLASVIFVIANSAVVLSGHYPAFFTASGPTLLRQVVLGSAVFLFAVASIIFAVQYSKSKPLSLFWYALAIALFSVGLFSAFEVTMIGDVPTWLGRAILYLGTAYLLAAILASRQKFKGSDLAGSWAEAFRGDRGQISALFSKMLDAFVYGKAIIDKSGKPIDTIILEVNDAFEQITGIKKENAVGKKGSELVPGVQNDPAGWISIYGRVAVTGEAVQFDNFLEPLKRWYHVSAYSPKKGYFVSIFEDITERKKAEDALRLSEERFSKAFNLSPFAVIMTRLSDGAYVDVNDTFLKMFEFTRNEVIGHTANEIKIYAKPEGRAAYLAAFKNGRVSDFEVDLKTKTGKPLKALGFAEIINVNGQDLTFGTLVDITERMKAEEALAKQAELIDLSPDAIIVRKLDGTITFWSKGAEKLYGWTKDEAIGQVTHNLFNTQFPQPLEEILAKLKADGRWSGEIVHTRKNGDKLILQSFWLAKFNENGKMFEMLESNVDITRRIELQTKIEESAVRLEEYANQMESLANQRAAQLKDAERLAAIGATAGMVGHDIRNPLQAITSDLYLARTEISTLPENELKANTLESLNEIEKNIEYINKIVADLQDYARPLNPRALQTNVKSVFNEVLSKNGVPQNIKVSVDIENEAKEIMVDPDYLKRIAANLTLNAVQAMPDGGKLTIRAYNDKQTNDVLITVKDTGVGIPEEVKPKLFTPMMTTKSNGQGFGLAVVKRMTEGLGGTVTFESTESKGTTFIVRLPPP